MVRIKGKKISNSVKLRSFALKFGPGVMACVFLSCYIIVNLVARRSLEAPSKVANSNTALANLREVKIRHNLPSLISRDSLVKVYTDVRGNLGPPSVMIQTRPGEDWIKDRWQAASDMHGTAIPGVHWVVLEFPSVVSFASKVILDWEAAYARDYRIEVSMDKVGWKVLFDSHIDSKLRTIAESGQSPGVKTKTPLHILHTITFPENEHKFKFLRVYIRKSAMGWGVSLWQLDVFGAMN